MANLKDQIQEKIRKERERSAPSAQDKQGEAGEIDPRLDAIRPRLDELAHTTDKYSLTVEYAKGPYAAVIAVIELDEADGTWVAAWQVATTVSGSVHDWEVTYNPHGVDTQHEWFKNTDDLFTFLTASIAERIVKMEADNED
ncbi:MAG: hypothetical protein QNJ07_05865 [Woeseiaceae bacterium]|nr:hypothetical protein [Woeseiaceae bacterium]